MTSRAVFYIQKLAEQQDHPSQDDNADYNNHQLQNGETGLLFWYPLHNS
jgi:hypothetical protein